MEIIISIMTVFKSMGTDKLSLKEKWRKRAQDNTPWNSSIPRSGREGEAAASDARGNQ